MNASRQNKLPQPGFASKVFHLILPNLRVGVKLSSRNRNHFNGFPGRRLNTSLSDSRQPWYGSSWDFANRRMNLNTRMENPRVTRLTNAASKKWTNNHASLAIYFAYYNFCRPASKSKRFDSRNDTRHHKIDLDVERPSLGSSRGVGGRSEEWTISGRESQIGRDARN